MTKKICPLVGAEAVTSVDIRIRAKFGVGRMERARRDIFEKWEFATDPANLQLRVKAGMKAAAGHVRKYPPPGFTQVQIERLIECIEAPWGVRYERQIRDCLKGASGVEASVAIAAKVKELGLEPFKPAAPLPPIEEDEIRLVCWIAVDEISS